MVARDLHVLKACMEFSQYGTDCFRSPPNDVGWEFTHDAQQTDVLKVIKSLAEKPNSLCLYLWLLSGDQEYTFRPTIGRFDDFFRVVLVMLCKSFGFLEFVLVDLCQHYDFFGSSWPTLILWRSINCPQFCSFSFSK